MKAFLICFASLLSSAKLQDLQYVNKIHNFSCETETGSFYSHNLTIARNNEGDDVFTGCWNFTKDVRLKNVHVIWHRCKLEQQECENFQKWAFTRNLKSLVYMKNQMWTPFFKYITPRFTDIPLIKKNIYCSPHSYIDAKEAVKFYPEVIHHFWRGEFILNDHDDKKAANFRFEISIVPVAENRRRERKNNARKGSLN